MALHLNLQFSAEEVKAEILVWPVKFPQIVECYNALTKGADLCNTYEHKRASEVLRHNERALRDLFSSVVGVTGAFSNCGLPVQFVNALADADDALEVVGLKYEPCFITLWEAILHGARELHKVSWKLHTYLADALLLQSQYDAARVHFQAGLELALVESVRRSGCVVEASVGIVLVKYAWCHRTQGRYDEALAAYSAAYTILSHNFGDNSHWALLAQNGVANVLCHRRQYLPAEELHRAVLAGRQSTLGVDHPETATSLNNLGNVVEAGMRWAEARELYQQAYTIRSSTLGRTHPDTLNSLISLLTAMEALGLEEEAERMRQELWPVL